ncbi:MAG: tetratricopeptide repeat protein, partial [Huintestinicola sp.]
DEIIAEQTEKAKSNPENSRETDRLVIALIYAERYDDAYSCFKEAIKKFSDDWRMYIHGGDICKWLGKYDEALEYYGRAGEIGTYFCDELYCKASLYEDLGEYEKSGEMYMKIADTLRQRGYDVEADMAEKSAEEVKKKIKE